MIEYWSAKGYGFPEEDVDFVTKMDTDLYALPKAKALPQSLELSSNGTQFAIWSSDRCVPIALWAAIDEQRDAVSIGSCNPMNRRASKSHTQPGEHAVQAGPGVLVQVRKVEESLR